MQSSPASGPGGGNFYLNFVIQGDDPKAKQLLAMLNDTTTAVQKTTKEVDNFVKTTKGLSAITIGRDLSRVGSELALAGGLATAGFISAANTYVERYKGLEKTANDYAAAQQKQADATADLGRVAAQALIPQLERAAEIEKQVAQFATEHPELVQAAVVGGGAVAIAGGALVAAGQVVSSIARLKQLLESDSVKDLGTAAGGAVTSILAAGAGVVVGAAASVAIIHARGDADMAAAKATGDATLAAKAATEQAYTMSDAFEGLRTAIGTIILGLSEAFVKGKEAIDAVVLDLQHISDPTWALEGQGAAVSKNGATPTLTSVTDSLKTYIDSLKTEHNLTDASAFNVAKQNLGLTAKDAKAATTIDKLAAVLEKNPQLLVGSPLADGLKYQPTATEVSPRQKALAAEQEADAVILKQIADGVTTWVKTGVIPTKDSPPLTTSTEPPESSKAFIAFKKQEVEAERVYGQQRVDAQAAYLYQLQIGNQEFQRSQADTAADQQRSHNESLLKAARDFAHNESEIARKAAHDRLVQQQEFNHSQLELAAEGDVAAYISAQKNRTFQLTQEDRQQAYDKSERLRTHEYDQQIQRIDELQAQADQRADAQRAHNEQLADQKKAFDHQADLAQIAYDRQTVQQQKAFAQQLADLQENVLGLKAIQDAANAQAAIDLEKYGEQYGNSLRDGLAKSLGYSGGQAGVAGAQVAAGVGLLGGLFNPAQANANAGYGPQGSSGGGSFLNTFSGGAITHNYNAGPVTIGPNNHVTESQVHDIVATHMGNLSLAIIRSRSGGGQ